MIKKEEFESKYLNITARITVVTPERFELPRAVLILLHGSLLPEGEYSIFEQLPEELELQEICDIHNIMIVLPFMPMNCYYISSDSFDCDSFLADELPAHLQGKFPFIPDIELFLGGVSMGGYGAVLVGAHTRRFKKILSISGAFIQNDIIIGNPEIWGQSTPDRIAESESFLNHFKPFAELEESDGRNAVRALQTFSVEADKFSFFLSCGTDDRLYKRNESFVRELQKSKINYVFVPLEGEGHDSSCFLKGLRAGIEWLF